MTQDLESCLGHRFGDRALLEQALTHASAAHEAGDAALSGERLEFLGDAVLGLLVTEALVRAAPAQPEGDLSRIRAHLVERSCLAAVAEEIGLAPHLRLGQGEEAGGGRDKPAILADACEAILGALYLDGGIEAAAALVETYWGPRLRRSLAPDADSPADPKSALQERLQAGHRPLPEYQVLAVSGPAHARHFVVAAVCAGHRLGTGEGASKRAAEVAAARRALSTLDASRSGEA
ncbi:MAG: ribonuclease III [Acidobacteriota bacterium]